MNRQTTPETGRPFVGKAAQLIYKPSFLDEKDMKRCLERELEDLSQALHKILNRIEALEKKLP